MGHAGHHAKNRTSLSGLDQKTLFFDLPLNNDTVSDDEVVASYVPPRCLFHSYEHELHQNLELSYIFLKNHLVRYIDFLHVSC